MSLKLLKNKNKKKYLLETNDRMIHICAHDEDGATSASFYTS